MKTTEVLLVEANHAVRTMLADGLREIGYRVWEVTDVYHILDLASVSVNVIVSNIHVPGLPVDKVFRRLRDVYPLAKVIAISGAPDVDDLTIDADRLLYKPFDAEGLDAAIKELLGEARPVKEMWYETGKKD